MSLYRFFSTSIKSSSTPVVSEVVKQFSKFSSHNELLEYSQRPILPLYPNRMIEACSPSHSTSIDLIQTASDLHNQLLVRVAHCLHHFQSLPFLPAANPTLLLLHQRYLKLFENLAHFPKIQTDADEEKFFNLINLVHSKSNDAIGQLASGCRDARKYFKTYEIMETFLDNVLQIRLGMRLISEHYLELHKQWKKGKLNDHWRGAICMDFSPHKAVQECIDDVSSICFETYSVIPQVEIEDNFCGRIPYFPHVVEYILRELLKNSMRAIVESSEVSLGNMQSVKKHFEDNQEEPLCKVLITSDPEDEHFTIAIQDRGGGIEETNDKVFQYMFTGDVTKEEEDKETNPLDTFQDTMIKSTKQMYGYGFGLPICRLYAQFFNGSLTLRQVSRIGTDVYLRLGFIHTNSEKIRI